LFGGDRATGECVLTRDAATPWGPCITERAAIGNRAQADVALSIHADGGPTSNKLLMQFTADIAGIEVLVAGGERSRRRVHRGKPV
jgi:N-acetylmuramoyl-L-alanine amidase